MPARLRTREASFALAADRAAPERRDGAGGFEEPSMLSITSIGSFASKIFGSSNDRLVKGYRPRVAAINALEAEVARLSDGELRARTAQFRKQLADGADLDDLLVPAFATVREAAKRTLGQRHFDVQLIGGMVLHEGKIAEMKTGEGKTLVATLPGLSQRACRPRRPRRHGQRLPRPAATPNGWAQIYQFLGLTVGCIVHELDDDQRRAAYALRRHLRHQQRIWLRLPARQHEDATSPTWCSARPLAFTPSSTRWTRS